MIFRFNAFALDTEGYVLTNGAEPVALEPQAFSLLQFLIENRDRVVSKDELIERVWNGRIVSDAALNSAINATRRAVGDDGKTQAVIKTFPRRGFRFVAKVDDGQNVNIVASEAIEFERPAIAVLPFNNLSGDPEQEYFVDGLTEDIITGLSAWRQFPVIGRNSSFSFKGKAVKAQEVADELGARYILEGSVRRGGDRLRISAQLLDGETGHQIWAERYERELADVFDLQDEITLRIVNIIAPEVERVERERSSVKPPANMDAWDHYLQGLQHFNQNRVETIPTARACFERALEVDPSYARAKAYLAYTYFRETIQGTDVDRDDTDEKLLRYAEEAVALDRNDAETHWILGLAYNTIGNPTRAIQSLQRALDLNPLHIPAQHTLGMSFGSVGRYEEAIPYLARAVEYTPRDPRNPNFVAGLSAIQMEAGRFEEAVEMGLRAIEAGFRSPVIIWRVIGALGHLGKTEEALKIMREHGLSPDQVLELYRDNTPVVAHNISESVIEGIRKVGLKIEGD